MSDQPKSKRVVLGGVVAVVLVALGVGVIALGEKPEAAPGPGAGAPPPANNPGGQVASASGSSRLQELLESQEQPPPQEGPPAPHCWQELQQLDQSLSLDNFRSVLSAAIARDDQLLLSYLQARLTRMVGNDPKSALQVLSWVEAAGGGPELIVYMEALKKAPAVQHQKVSSRLLELAENPQGSLPVRAAAAIGLETQKRLEPATLKRMKAIAVDPREDQVAWNATRTIGRVMEEEFKSTGTYRPYWEQLLEISQKSEERSVRGLALEMPTYPELILDEGSVGTLSEILRTDRDAEIRELAAMRLSVTEAPQKALEAYRAAFPTESEYCVRWALLRYALRAAGAAALPLVEQFAQQEPRLQQDYLDFKELYAQGTMDWERIWLNKKIYPEHIACMDSHQEGQ